MFDSPPILVGYRFENSYKTFGSTISLLAFFANIALNTQGTLVTTCRFRWTGC